MIVGAADRDMAEGGAKRLQHLLTQLLAGRDRQLGICRDVGDAAEVADLAVEHVAHEEMLGQPPPPSSVSSARVVISVGWLAACIRTRR